MRRLWMSALLAPVLALVVPAVALATTSAPAARTARAAVQGVQGVQLAQHGLSVRELQRRLAALKYYPGAIDGNFGTNTLEAVWAFYEVQGLAPHNYVDSAMKWRLAH